jgi:YVTN family beta-propeller protein
MRARRLAAATAATMAMVLAWAAPAMPATTREALLVGNNWDGTVDALDPRTFERLARIDVVPDLGQRMLEMSPDELVAFYGNRELAGEGHDQLVDDVRVSPDGMILYVSRPSLGDVAAFDLATRTLRWRVEVSGLRSDHLALSPDGARLVVSATTANVVDVIDTATHTIVGGFGTGDFPHENEYSADGALIYNGSIGRVVAPDDPLLDAAKGNRWFTVVDAKTLQVRKVIDFKRGVRPFVVMPDGKTMYVQLSFMHGLVEYDLEQERELRTLHLPLSDEAKQMRREDYPLDSAHHGLAMNADGSKLCAAGTVSDYAAIITRGSLTVDGIVPVGDKPYWATASTDGRYCFLANSDSDDVSVVSFRTATEVARIPVGDHPQRMRVVDVLL